MNFELAIFQLWFRIETSETEKGEAGSHLVTTGLGFNPNLT